MLETRWLHLTRAALTEVAGPRRWSVSADHCFQRILLDAAAKGVWYDRVAGRPAYRHADDALLADAVRLGERVLDGREELEALNRQSLAWRRARRAVS